MRRMVVAICEWLLLHCFCIAQKQWRVRFVVLWQVHRSLLTDVLLPLHEPNQMAVWSIQQPLIESYHEALVGCLVPFLELQSDLAEVVFKAIAAAWPRGFNSNTAKVGPAVLLCTFAMF